MDSKNDTEESEEDYDDPNYWFQMEDRILEGNLNSSLENMEDDVIVVDSGANYHLTMDDGSVFEFIEFPEDVPNIQNQNPEDYEILDEEVIFTPDSEDYCQILESESEDVDIIWDDAPPHEDHTYSMPTPREARILKTIDNVIRKNRFRSRRDVRNPPSPKSKLYHLSRGPIPYTRTPKMVLEPAEIERWSLLRIRNPFIRPLDVHGFSNIQLCKMACLNAPDGRITTNCAVNFILHHFPYYRFDRLFTMDHVRNALRRKGYFESVKIRGTIRIMFFSVAPDEMDFTEEQFLAMDMDPRGRAFFDKMLRGELGLPRQLFYHVIAASCPQLAGPENSALFYHFLSHGHVPPRGSAHFKIHLEPCMAIEPKFEEEQKIFPSSHTVKRIDKLRFFGVNGFGAVIDQDYSNRFFASIEGYFETQNFWKGSGLRNWETPRFG